MTRGGGNRYWVLADGNEIYCSVETLRRPLLVRTRGGGGGGGLSWGVAGVFTLES